MTDDIKPVLTEQDIEDIIMTGGHSNVAGGIYATSVYAFAKDVAIAAVLADREGRQQWQPIETAPEGVMLLLADMTAQEARHWAYVDWLVAGKCCSNRHHTPTHWMPLPAPPADAQRDKEE